MTLDRIDRNEIHRRIEQAITTRDREIAKYYRADGQPMLSDVEMQDRLAPIIERYEREIAAVASRMEREQVEINRGLRILDADPLSRLSSDDLIRANAISDWVEADVGSRPLAALQKELETAIAMADTPRLAMLHRHAGRWIEARRTEAVTGQLSAADRQRFRGLGELVELAAAALADPDAEKERTKFERRRQALKPLRDALNKATGEDRDAIRDRYLAQARGRAR